MGKHKKNKPKKEKKEIVYRTKEQRQQEVREILKQLSKFELTPRYEPVKDLYKQFKQYIDTGDRIEINIPFPIADVDIVGVLATDVKERVYMKFTKN